jgi:hypothetical protein
VHSPGSPSVWHRGELTRISPEDSSQGNHETLAATGTGLIDDSSISTWQQSPHSLLQPAWASSLALWTFSHNLESVLDRVFTSLSPMQISSGLTSS